jgi:hypothetical protein
MKSLASHEAILGFEVVFFTDSREVKSLEAVCVDTVVPDYSADDFFSGNLKNRFLG